MRLPRIARCARLLTLFSFLPALASAHTGHDSSQGLSVGFFHPFCGLDHLLAMIAVGLWAAQLGGRAQWLVPSSFLGAMLVGAACAANGFRLPITETMIIGSLVALGGLISGAVRLPVAVASAAVAAFALFHGSAHGAELPASVSGLQFGAGFLLATALLHAAGVALGRWSRGQAAVIIRLSGAALALGSAGLLLS